MFVLLCMAAAVIAYFLTAAVALLVGQLRPVAEHVLFEQEFKPTFPGLVAIAANIDAAALERLPGFDIRNSHIDIQDQVTDLLHPGHDGALRADFFGEIKQAYMALTALSWSLIGARSTILYWPDFSSACRKESVR